MSKMSKSYLKNQVEKIIDTGKGKRRNVIIQMESPKPTSEKILNIAAEVYRRRNQSLTARDLLPAEQEQLEELIQSPANKLTADAQETLNHNTASLAIQTAIAKVLPLQIRRNNGFKAL